MPTMTQSEFMQHLHKHVGLFNKYIDKCNEKYPEAKAENLNEADWFDQFSGYIELKEE